MKNNDPKNIHGCDNCNSTLQNDKETGGITKIKVQNEFISEIQIWDALVFIYGVNWNAFHNYASEKGHLQQSKSPDDLKFCQSCVSILSENFNAHRNFENSCHPTSIVELLKKFRVHANNVTISEFPNVGDTEENSNDHLLDNFTLLDDSMEDMIHSQQSETNDIKCETTMSALTEDLAILPNSSPILPQSDQSHNSFSGKRQEGLKKLVIKTEKMSDEEIRARTSKTRPNLSPLTTNFEDDVKTEDELEDLSPEQEEKVKKVKQFIKGRPENDVPIKNASSFQEKGRKATRTKFQSICEVCGKCVRNARFLEHHVLRAHASDEEKTKWKVACDVCGVSVFPFDMGTHIYQTHNDGPKHKCEECGKEFLNKHKLKKHYITHTQTSKKCEFCEKVFCGLPSLRCHINTVHGQKERRFQCDVCPSKFFSRADLESHKLSHSDVRKYVCEECGKTFKYPKHLKMHLKMHIDIQEKGEGAFRCELCDGKTFKHSVSLQRHKQRKHLHATPKTYECPVCAKHYSSAYNLKVHANIHKKSAVVNNSLTC